MVSLLKRWLRDSHWKLTVQNGGNGSQSRRHTCLEESVVDGCHFNPAYQGSSVADHLSPEMFVPCLGSIENLLMCKLLVGYLSIAQTCPSTGISTIVVETRTIPVTRKEAKYHTDSGERAW